MTFPVTFPIGSFALPAHVVFESLGYFLGFRAYLVLRRRWGDAIHENTRWSVIAAAAVGVDRRAAAGVGAARVRCPARLARWSRCRAARRSWAGCSVAGSRWRR